MADFTKIKKMFVQESDDEKNNNGYVSQNQDNVYENMMKSINANLAGSEEVQASSNSGIDLNKQVTIDSIYAENNLVDAKNSVFKVEQIKAALPKEMATDVMRQSVIGVLPVSGLSLENIKQDAVNRVTAINETGSNFAKLTANIIEENNNSIAEYEAKINEAKEVIAARKKLQEDQDAIFDNELTRISNIVKFLDPNIEKTAKTK